MMKEVMSQILGVYSPIDGCVDWSYVAGAAVFCICLYSMFRLIGLVFKR